MKRGVVPVLLCLGLAARGLTPVWAEATKEAKPMFSEFHDMAPGLPVAFKYPKDWKLEEEKGVLENYQLVRLLGPRNPDDTYTSYISITASPVKEQGGKFADLAEIVKNYKEHQLAGARVDDEKVTVVGGQGAVEMTVTSVLPPSLHRGLKPLETPVRNRALFTQKRDVLYRITYSADVRIYDRHVGQFDRLLETLQFE